MTPWKDKGDYLYKRRGIEKQKHIYAYVKTVNYLLNSFATDNVIAETATKVEAFKQRPVQTAVSFDEALKDNAQKCEEAFLEQRAKSIFV